MAEWGLASKAGRQGRESLRMDFWNPTNPIGMWAAMALPQSAL